LRLIGSYKWKANSKFAKPRPLLAFCTATYLPFSQTVQTNNDALSSDLKASKQSEKQLDARVRALTASFEKIEAEVARDNGESSASMAVLIEQSRRFFHLLLFKYRSLTGVAQRWRGHERSSSCWRRNEAVEAAGGYDTMTYLF
jgi:hypothetical protein